LTHLNFLPLLDLSSTDDFRAREPSSSGFSFDLQSLISPPCAWFDPCRSRQDEQFRPHPDLDFPSCEQRHAGQKSFSQLVDQ
jgi:hypothetical protein